MILGPYERKRHATFDETAFVAAVSDNWPNSDARRIMLDVGAHGGGSLIHFAKRGWQVYAFEPDPKNRSTLINFTRGFENVVISDRAVSDVSDEEVALYSSQISTGISTLSPFHESHRPEVTVKTTTLRDFIAQQAISRVDFLKIDVEGFEMKVLAGFPWDILIPSVVECEFENAKTTRLGYTAAQLVEFLFDKGYSVYVSEWHPVVRYGVKHDWRYIDEYKSGSITDHAWGNLIAFRERPDRSLLASVAASLVSFRTANPIRIVRSHAEMRKFISRCVHALRRRPNVVRVGIITLMLAGTLAMLPAKVAAPAGILAVVLIISVLAKRRVDKGFLETNRLLRELTVEKAQIVRKLEDCSAKVTALDRMSSKSGYVNASRFQPFDRALKERDIAHLHEVWAPLLGLEIPRSAIGYMGHRIAVIESICAGRLATTVETAVLRTLVAYAVRGPSLKVLEIGTLFGVSVAAIYDICHGKFEDVRIAVIDPFDGYYGENKADIATGQAVTEMQFRRNMQRIGVDAKELTVIRSYSQENAAVAAAAANYYDVLYIDGDHSGEGVRRDFDLYYGMVKKGGFIVFDDYGTDHWPEIKPVVDEHVMPRPDLEFIGADYRTAVFRVRGGDESAMPA